MLIPFAIQSAQDLSLPSSAERAVNFYAQQLPPNAKTPVEVLGTPGLLLFSSLGGATIRAARVWNGAVYAVSGTGLFRVTVTGASTMLGSLPAIGEVYLADNGDQLGILVGASLYVWNGATLTLVSDSDYPGASSFDVLDGFGVFTEPNSREWFISALNDLTAYDALDIASAESTPDNLVRVVADRELWFFKTNSSEVWYNAGTDFPFARVDGGRIPVGLAAPKAVARCDNSLIWLTDKRTVARANGFSAVRISTHSIEETLRKASTLADAFAWSYAEGGHEFWGVTGPTAGFSVVYDAATQLWHDRQTRDMAYWRPSCYVNLQGLHLWGDSLSGNIYRSDLDTYTEADDLIIRTAVSPPIKAANERIRATCGRFEVNFESGVGITTGQGENPQAMMKFSDDGGKTWSNERWRSMGRIGENRWRAVWHRNGQFRHTRVFKITVSDPVKFVISSAYADIVGGTL